MSANESLLRGAKPVQIPLAEADPDGSSDVAQQAAPARPEPSAELRRHALAASTDVSAKGAREARRSYYERSAAVRAYVLARANGRCEACGEPAPFQRPDGTPYLEPHHTRRVSDGGPDHPRSVAALCPTCHRRIHHGSDGAQVNERLIALLGKIEGDGGRPFVGQGAV